MNDRMSYFNSRALFSGIAISYLFTLTGSSFWISGIIGIILGVIVLLLIKQVNDLKIIKLITGFVLATLALIVLVNLGHTLYLKDTPLLFLTIFPVGAATIISNSKDESLKKTIWIFFAYSIFLFFLKIIGLYSHIDMENLHPLLPIDFKSTLWGAIVFMLVGVVPILSLNDISDKKNIIVNYVISMLITLTVCFLAVSVLGIKEVRLYRYPEYVVLKRIEFLNFINNVDSFFNFAIIVDLLFTVAAGIRCFDVSIKPVKYSIIGIMALFTIWACNKAWFLLLIYRYLPFILIFLLILLLIPKKRKYKS